MKKIILPFIMMCMCSSVGFSQDFKPFKVGLGLGYTIPGGEGAGGGILFYAEPAYRASDLILILLRLEAAAIARGVTGVGNSDAKGDLTTNTSYTLNGQYYFNDHYVRPFIGAGLGLFALASTKFNTLNNNTIEANEVKAETAFGFYPRIGIDIGHFNFTLDYNIIPPTKTPWGSEVKNNYLGIRLGVSIGGGVGAKN